MSASSSSASSGQSKERYVMLQEEQEKTKNEEEKIEKKCECKFIELDNKIIHKGVEYYAFITIGDHNCSIFSHDCQPNVRYCNTYVHDMISCKNPDKCVMSDEDFFKSNIILTTSDKAREDLKNYVGGCSHNADPIIKNLDTTSRRGSLSSIFNFLTDEQKTDIRKQAVKKYMDHASVAQKMESKQNSGMLSKRRKHIVKIILGIIGFVLLIYSNIHLYDKFEPYNLLTSILAYLYMIKTLSEGFINIELGSGDMYGIFHIINYYVGEKSYYTDGTSIGITDKKHSTFTNIVIIMILILGLILIMWSSINFSLSFK